MQHDTGVDAALQLPFATMRRLVLLIRFDHSMRSLSSIAVFAWSATLLTAAVAQQSTEAPAPPQLETLEEGEPPAITIRKPGGDDGQQITQTKKGGRVTEIRVKTGGSTYYLKPNDPAGSALPGDAQAPVIRPPQWEVLEFDLTRQKEEAEQADDEALPAGAEAVPPAAKEAPAARRTASQLK